MACSTVQARDCSSLLAETVEHLSTQVEIPVEAVFLPDTDDERVEQLKLISETIRKESVKYDSIKSKALLRIVSELEDLSFQLQVPASAGFKSTIADHILVTWQIQRYLSKRRFAGMQFEEIPYLFIAKFRASRTQVQHALKAKLKSNPHERLSISVRGLSLRTSDGVWVVDLSRGERENRHAIYRFAQ